MPRCDGCGNRRCSCVLIDGDNTTVAGSGSPDDPFSVSVDLDGVVGASRVTGEIIAFAGGTAPGGWLMANGAAVSRTTYADLFAVCGETYGEGDGSTTFNLPDLAGRFPFGADGAHVRGTEGGAENTTIATGNLPPHTHTLAHTHTTADTHFHFGTPFAAGGGPSGTVAPPASTPAAGITSAPSTPNTGNGPGASTPLTNMPPYVAVAFIIKT